MSDSARKREKIVSLSQTEMMFVIAAVALVLFLLADTQRRTAQTSESKISEELTALRETAARDDAPSEEDMLAEVAEILTAEGALAAGENSPQRLRREIPDAVRELARQKNESAAAQKEIDDALSATDDAADTADAADADSRAQRIRRLLQDAARGEAAADALGVGDTPPATIAAEIKNLRRAIEGKDTRGNTLDHKLRFRFFAVLARARRARAAVLLRARRRLSVGAIQNRAASAFARAGGCRPRGFGGRSRAFVEPSVRLDWRRRIRAIRAARAKAKKPSIPEQSGMQINRQNQPRRGRTSDCLRPRPRRVLSDL